MKSSVIFDLNYASTTKVNVNQGGTSSGKTYGLLQLCFILAMNDPGTVTTVVGQDYPNLKKGAIRDSQKIVSTEPEVQLWLKNFAKFEYGYNQGDHTYRFKNGSIIEFASYANEQDAKSGKRDYLFINEANGIPYMVYWQLAYRTRKKVFLDYNPTAKFWVHEKLVGEPYVSYFITDHRHNPYLSAEQHAEIEGIPDKELWDVYARGKTGQIKGLIYPKWYLTPAMPPLIDSVFGLDFGYTHKMALVEVAHEPGRLYWDEWLYETDMTVGDLVPRLKEFNLHLPFPGKGKKRLYCDHARADMIEDLKRAGFNALKADKDVENGIDYCKRHTLYITSRSAGLRKEAGGYKWEIKKDPFGAELETGKPLKFMDDGMDAGRYGSYSHRKMVGISASDAQRKDADDELLSALN